VNQGSRAAGEPARSGSVLEAWAAVDPCAPRVGKKPEKVSLMACATSSSAFPTLSPRPCRSSRPLYAANPTPPLSLGITWFNPSTAQHYFKW
jgi:hypothetical protein